MVLLNYTRKTRGNALARQVADSPGVHVVGNIGELHPPGGRFCITFVHVLFNPLIKKGKRQFTGDADRATQSAK